MSVLKHYITYNGIIIPLVHAAKLANISRSTLWHRIDAKWDLEAALTADIKDLVHAPTSADFAKTQKSQDLMKLFSAALQKYSDDKDKAAKKLRLRAQAVAILNDRPVKKKEVTPAPLGVDPAVLAALEQLLIALKITKVQ